jgi:hypothetical protein
VFFDHLVVGDENEGKALVVACAYCLLLNVKIGGFPAIKPGVCFNFALK